MKPKQNQKDIKLITIIKLYMYERDTKQTYR